MPTAGLDRAPRSAPPPAVTPQVSPPQVHPRVEPTPINGYPATHARTPSPADTSPRMPQPDTRPVSPARPPAHGMPDARTDTGPSAGPQAGSGAHAGPVTPTFEMPRAGQAQPGAADASGPRLDVPRAGNQQAPAQRRPVEQDPPTAPIARLASAGPDTDRHYADADLAPNWFTTKAEPATPEPADTASTEDAATPGPAPANPAQPSPYADASNVVLDLDLTGLLNGMTPEQAIMAAPPNAAGPHAEPQQTETQHAETRHNAPPVRDGSEQAPGQQWSGPAFPTIMPGHAPTAPKPPAHPLRPLSAEDLEAIRWRLDGGTLREVVDDRDALREIGERLDEPLADEEDNATRAGLLSVRAEVYRLLGELGMAAAASRLALAHAESARDVRATVIAQAELAHVLRLRGDFAEADRLFEQAAGSEAPELLRSVVHENAGRSCFDQGRHMEALDHFARAIRLGDPEDTDLAARIAVCLEAVYIHVLRDGWGSYPRLRREILGEPDAPAS
jgi:tetratricopeptide (TPR) repeat protein